MRIIQARCEVVYEGRCKTFLPPAERLIVMKDDDTVLVHGNTGVKPINYMPKVTNIEHTTETANDGMTSLQTMVVSNKHETLHIRIYEIVRDDTYEFPEGTGTGGLEELQKRQSEDELQGWLADNFDTVFGGYGVRFVCREFETGKGPVDLLGTSSKDGSIALIEVKRHAKLKDVYQVLRYKHATGEQYALLTAQGMDEFPAYSRKTSIATGSLPKQDAVMLPTSALRKPLLFLVAERFTSGADTECEKNGVIAITTHALGIGDDAR